MAAFSQLDWTRFDVWAAVAMDGVVVVDKAHRKSCKEWLRRHDYSTDSVDFESGVGPAVVEVGRLFRWQEQFGYELTSDSRNLDALRDGFEFDLKPGTGQVFELLNADVAYVEDRRWLLGLLAIAHEYSYWQLALGSRFFTVLYLDRDSKLIGQSYESLSVPVPYWKAAAKPDPFQLSESNP